MQQRFLAPVLLVITALLWSLGGVLIKSIDWPPMAIAAGRSIAAIPVTGLRWPRLRWATARQAAAVHIFTCSGGWRNSLRGHGRAVRFCHPDDNRRQRHFPAIHGANLRRDHRALVSW